MHFVTSHSIRYRDLFCSPTAINLPAQSIYPSLPTLYALFKAAGIKKTIWTCSKLHSTKYSTYQCVLTGYSCLSQARQPGSRMVCGLH